MICFTGKRQGAHARARRGWVEDPDTEAELQKCEAKARKSRYKVETDSKKED